MAGAVDNYQSSLELTQVFSLAGVFPSRDGGSAGIPLGGFRTFAGNFGIGGAPLAQGQILSIAQNTAVFSLLGTYYGGNGQTTFALPDLNGRTMIGTGQGPGLSDFVLGEQAGSAATTLINSQLPAKLGGGSQPFDNYEPSLAITYVIRVEGIYQGGGPDMIGEVVPFAPNFVPGVNFMQAAGQLLPISEYETLFSLIGTTYGGDGETTFALPDLRGRTIIGTSPQAQLGQILGQGTTTLTNQNLPVSVGGIGTPFENREPSLALNYIIALQGV